MVSSIEDKLKTEETRDFIVTAKQIEEILMFIDTAENFSEEIGYYTNKKYKDRLKESRDRVYTSIVDTLYSTPCSIVVEEAKF